MIQRIQTLWMLAAAALVCAAMFLPAAYFTFAEGRLTILPYGTAGAGAFAAGTQAAAKLASTGMAICVMVLMALAAAMPLAAIFFYKNRRMQVHMLTAEYFLLACGAISLAYYVVIAWRIMTKAGGEFEISWLPLILLGSFVFNGLALRGVKRDENLVRSADRVR